MVTKINLPLTATIIALAIVGWSFLNSDLQNVLAANAIVGTPPSSFCTDTDNLNVNYIGNCTDVTGTYTDVCHPNGGVSEWYCAPNNLCSTRRIRCGYKETCVEGRCVAL